MGISHRQNEYLYSYTKDTPPELKMHLHKYYEFLHFQSGDASYIVEDNIYHIDKGDILITRPEELHTLAFHSDKIYERRFMQLSRDFLSEFEVLFKKIDAPMPGTGNRIPRKTAEKYDLYSFFEKIEYYIIHRLPESDAMIKSYFIQFLVRINSIKNTKKESGSDQSGRIDDILNFLTDNISSDITLDYLADKFYINKYYMCHSFKEHTGLTIKEFMNTRKITRAKNLLQNGAEIMTLCYDCGFNDYSTFYKTFKKLTGKSPKEFLNGD